MILPAEGTMEREALADHPPETEPDDMGRHLLWAWHPRLEGHLAR